MLLSGWRLHFIRHLPPPSKGGKEYRASIDARFADGAIAARSWVLFSARPVAGQEAGAPLPGTKPLTMTGDIASELVAGADRFLLKQIEESAAKREKYWKRDFSSAEAYQASVEPNRKRLAHILGVRDARVRPGRSRYRTDMLDLGQMPPRRNSTKVIGSMR